MKATAVLSTIIILSFSTAFVTRMPADAEPELSGYQREVIEYFNEVALGFEYGNASGITRKWETPMSLYVSGIPTPELTEELGRVISELNTLFSDGFQISLTENKSEASFIMYFGSRTGFTSLYPRDASTVERSSGLFHIFWNSENEITRGYAFVHTIGTSVTEQKHTIREELTQALGLGKDSPRYAESIFQSSWSTPTEYTPIDRELIRLLYHPRMTAGADEKTARELLAEIFASELVASSAGQRAETPLIH